MYLQETLSGHSEMAEDLRDSRNSNSSDHPIAPGNRGVCFLEMGTSNSNKSRLRLGPARFQRLFSEIHARVVFVPGLVGSRWLADSTSVGSLSTGPWATRICVFVAALSLGALHWNAGRRDATSF